MISDLFFVSQMSSPSSKNPTSASRLADFVQDLKEFKEFESETQMFERSFMDGELSLPYFLNEFWTSRQRAAHSLHEVSYRACFKPQLPRFFIERLTSPGDRVYDPFMGRGTTILEAALCDREVVGCDVNPLAPILARPRLCPPSNDAVKERLSEISWSGRQKKGEELNVFFHPKTLVQLRALQKHFESNELFSDEVDDWIRMVATNRLTGHSAGFFSVYTLPPNQATSLVAQRKINEKRNQEPEPRDVAKLVERKSRSLLKHLTVVERQRLSRRAQQAQFITSSADSTPTLASESVDLVVTSPPFLDVIDYQGDNWLRCWFNGLNAYEVKIWKCSKTEQWQEAMQGVFVELYRVLKPGGFVAFEVGEVRNGAVLLEDYVVPAALAAGLQPQLVFVNEQEFTKTANCWGINNLSKGTNTNRIVLLQKI